MFGRKQASYEFLYGLYERYRFDSKNACFYMPKETGEFYRKDERGISTLCRSIDSHTPIVFQSYETIIFIARVHEKGSALAPYDRLLSVSYSTENMHYSSTTCKQTRQMVNELMRYYGCTACTWHNLDDSLVKSNGILTLEFPSYEWRHKHNLEMYLKINYDFRVGHACVWCS